MTLTFTGSIVTYMYTMAPNRGSANLYIDNKPQAITTIKAYAPEVRWRSSRTLNVGYGTHTLVVATIGDGYFDIDAIGIDGNFATGTSIYEETSADKFLSTTWTTGSFPSASGGATAYSQTTGDGVNFAFYGSGVSLIFARATNRGYAKITIDGNDMGTIDQYGSSIQWQQRVDFRGLAAGYHVINVTVAGAKQAASSGYFVDVDGFQIAGCPRPECRAWAEQERYDGNYTGLTAILTHGVPTIRDYGFSAEVLWMGDILHGKNYIEVGWRRDTGLGLSGPQANQTRLYWGYWDENRWWTGPPIENWLGDDTTAHTLEIRRINSDPGGMTLAVYVDYVEQGRVYFYGLTPSTTYVGFGGEVTDYIGGVHNAMGVGDFTYLQFNQGLGYTDWPADSINQRSVDYNYQSVFLANGHWQAYGYNP